MGPGPGNPLQIMDSYLTGASVQASRSMSLKCSMPSITETGASSGQSQGI